MLEKSIKSLLNRNSHPVFLSNIDSGNIVFLNDAAKKEFNQPVSHLKDSTIHDLFSTRRIIGQRVIWECDERKFEIDEEKLELNGSIYIHSVVAPVGQPKEVLDLIQIQQEMARLMVHLFHSPLNGASGFTELLQALNLTDKQASYASAIEKGLNELKEILSEVNSLAQDVEVHKTTINVQKFSRAILNQFVPGERRRIKLAINDNLFEVYSDYVLLKKIIMELLNNALEFCPEGHQRIDLHFKDRHTISVTSFGSGIPLSEKEKIFYPFYSSKAKGIGLGLSKSLYFAHEMGYDLLLTKNSSVHGVRFELRM